MNGTIVAETQREETHLTFLVKTGASIEKARIALSNRLSAIERGADAASQPIPEEYGLVFVHLQAAEDALDPLIARALTEYPVWDSWLCHVKGIAPTLGGQMLALLLPPRPGDDVGSWYKAAGLLPQWRPDQELFRLPKARAGEGKITYYPYLRRCLHNVAVSFVRVGGYYRERYDHTKARLQAIHEGDKQWPPHRIESVSRWITVKLFLSAMFEEYCAVTGLPRPRPYIIAIGGHEESHYIPPPQWDGKNKI